MPDPTAAEFAAKIIVGDANLDRLNSAINDAPGTFTTDEGVSVRNLRGRLDDIGYKVPVAFASGLEPQDGSFTVVYNGDRYAADPGSTPFTTTGTFVPAEWVLIDKVFTYATQQEFWDSTRSHDDDTIVDVAETGFSYKAVPSGAHVTNAGGQGFEVMLSADATYNLRGFGDMSVSDVAAEVSSAISAISAIGGGIIRVPDGVYNVQSEITLKSNVWLFASHKARFTVNNASSFRLFVVADDLDNVVIDGLGFDGGMNYPTDSTVYKATMSNVNYAIQLSGSTVSKLRIRNCDFKEFSGGSIDINGLSSNDIIIEGNDFYKASYLWKAISLRIPSSTYTESQMVRDFRISGNTVNICGPQSHYDASKEDWTASADGIQVDSGKDGIVTDNGIFRAGGVGIRIEESIGVTVSVNRTNETGQDGISCYKGNINCAVVGNTVRNWGRIPNAYCIRSFGGVNYIAREFPHVTDAPLPADPSTSPWFDVWPYTLDGVNPATIVAYGASDYYAGSSVGILPFRGYAGIACIFGAVNQSTTGNTIAGDTTQVSGKYTNASDFGYSVVHSVNSAFDGTGGNSTVTGNTFSGTITADIYHPEYMDPINENGLNGTSVYTGNTGDGVNVIFSGDSTYSQGQFVATLSPSSGTITLGPDDLAWAKVGRLVTVTGELLVSAVSSPSGQITLSLPFTTLGGGRRGRGGCFVHATGLTGSPTGAAILMLENNTGSGTLSILDDFVSVDLGPHVQVNSSFRLTFSYLAAA